MNTALDYTFKPAIATTNTISNTGGIAEKNKRFEIHAMEWMEFSLNAAAEKLNRFEILWIKKGRGTVWVDEQKYEITENSIYCFAPGCVRKYNFEINVEGYYISFAPEFIWLSEGYSANSSWPGKYNEHFSAAAINIDENTYHELEVIVSKMKWEFSNYFNQRLELLKGLLNIFMIYFSRNVKNSECDTIQNKESELVRKFMTLLKKNFIDQKMVSDYAGQLCVTPNYLNRTVKKITGFTASHHIQQQIVLEAKRRAIYSSSSMKEIAYYLGFDNLAHFSKFFKNNCGMSFTNFKNSALKPE